MESSLITEVLNAMPEATVLTREGRVLHVNRGFERLFGYAAADCVGEDLDEMVIPEGRLHESEMILHGVGQDGSSAVDSVRRARGGELVEVSVLAAAVRLDDGAQGLFVRYRDIRREKREEARLQHTALHDALTGLANRALFLNRVQLTMQRLRRRPDRLFAVIFLDLDGFKRVNDTHGHAAGDALLLRVAQRLSRIVRPQDTVARLGGDEFALLIDESVDAAEIEEMARRIQAEIKRTILLDTAAGAIQAHVSGSMGIVLATTAYTSAQAMLRDADEAMYAAKAAGKSRHVLFACASA